MTKLQLITKGLIKENPTFVLMLGMCPTLGTTTSAINGMSMGIATMFVLIMSNIVISLVKNVIPAKVRIPSFIVIIASFVTVVQLVMQAYVPDLYNTLGVFIPLIVVNCIILGRAEAFASKHGPFASMLDGTFGYDFNGAMPKKVRNAKDEFTERVCLRLQHVTIENRNALDVIACYDSPDTFHFVDPPYVNSDCGHYEGVFSEQNLEQLLDLLETVKGRFMLTMFPFELIDRRAQRNGWTIHRIARTISASKTSRRRQEEWIVCNYADANQSTLFGVI